MFDTIFIRGMILMGKHGVFAKERTVPQRFAIDIEMKQKIADWKENIRNTYNYMKARDIARNHVEGKTYFLIETMAEQIAKDILAHRLVEEVTVTVHKLDVLPEGEVGVSITRSR